MPLTPQEFVSQIENFLSRLNRKSMLVFVFLVISLLGVVDFLTGFEVAFSFFYLIPVVLATWYLGHKEGRATAFLCTFIWAASNRLAGEFFANELIRYWNTGLRFGIFILFTELLHGLKLALLHEQTLSRTDFLTGINNRREFYDRADLEILHARRYKHPVTLALLDVDSFKHINDSLGHSEGDKLLKIIAQTISSAIRKTDIVARMGGDEFAIILPNTDPNGARHTLEKLKVILTEKMSEAKLPVTFSLGTITFLSIPESADDMLNKADQLMYSVKERGKNGIAYQTVEE
jgi:diguanylate cyclase (GGDEF)-like protein